MGAGINSVLGHVVNVAWKLANRRGPSHSYRPEAASVQRRWAAVPSA